MSESAHRIMMNIFLLTPLREGRPISSSDSAPRISISTHAPAGGATSGIEPIFSLSYISTHAPAGGATDMDAVSKYRWSDFYSRPCGRGDGCNTI